MIILIPILYFDSIEQKKYLVQNVLNAIKTWFINRIIFNFGFLRANYFFDFR
ncbi:MAG: hypothetical protein RLZZ417_2167 [Bacteroidota bacterium]|jgi:hypothetical protein